MKKALSLIVFGLAMTSWVPCPEGGTGCGCEPEYLGVPLVSCEYVCVNGELIFRECTYSDSEPGSENGEPVKQ